MRRRLLTLAYLTLLVAACTGNGGGDEATTTLAPDEAGHSLGPAIDDADLSAANLAAAAFQDVEMAEVAGYASTLETLGCFENGEAGGMGLHYLNETLMDANVDVTTPEALVYELAADGEIAGLVAHEYIVPVEAWTNAEPPTLFDRSFHQHPVLPLWVLHAWIWKDNPAGMFEDWNPAVRPCPENVPVFGVDLP